MELKYNKYTDKFFGETAIYESDEEIEQAKTYLELWKKYLLRTLRRDSFDVKVLHEQWIERKPEIFGCLSMHGCISLKLLLQADFYKELK